MLLKKSNNIEETDEINTIFSTFEIYILINNYNKLIQYGVEYNKPSIIDKLKPIIDITQYIKTLYNVNINMNTSGKKIIQLIKSGN